MERQNERIIEVIEKEIKEALKNPGDVVMKVNDIRFSGRVIEANIHIVIDGNAQGVLSAPGVAEAGGLIKVPEVKAKRKYTKRGVPVAGTKPQAKSHDIKLMKKDLKRWDLLGHLNENEVKAWMSLSGVYAGIMSSVQKEQLANLHAVIAKKANGDA
jgi:hypothetical protein